MQFFVVSTERSGVIDCTLSIRAAHRSGRGTSPTGEYTVVRVSIRTATPTETIRRLLGNLGGYADESVQVYPKE